jgi:hypothetical protein
MAQRFHQILLVLSILWLSWLTMMLVHESGHVIGALATGGHVRRVVWHPTVISRTDVQPNPHPLIEVWAGPVFGSLLPLVAAAVASLLRLRAAYLVWVMAGFCLIANGAYIGVGAFHPVGDAQELIAHGVPPWILAVFGVIALVAGFWIWHRASPRLGFGSSPEIINPKHAYPIAGIAAVVTVLGFAFGNAGA